MAELLRIVECITLEDEFNKSHQGERPTTLSADEAELAMKGFIDG
jgi:hypothetical protein